MLTLVVTKQIGTSPFDDHWQIRLRAAQIVKRLRDRYSDRYGRLHARLLQTYLQAITDTSKSLPTQYGGIVGITAMGHRAVYHLLVPAMRALKERYADNTKDARMCQQALFDAALMLTEKLKEMMLEQRDAGVCDELRDKKRELVNDEFNAEETFRQLHEIFGDLVVPTTIVASDVKDVVL